MLLLALLACGKTSSEDTIDRWVEEQGVEFRDCGALAFQLCEGAEIDPAEQAVINCLTGAWASCEAATLEVSEPTIEGDPIVTTYFVVPTESGCTVTRFIDNTQDSFGDGLIHQYDCAGLLESADCPYLGAEACVEVE